MRMKSFMFLMAISSLFTGCTLSPNYERPKAPVDATWPQGPAYEAQKPEPDAKPVEEIPWKAFFISMPLQTVIQTALDNNRDLRIAILNIEVASAIYRAQRADLFPTINAGSSFLRQKLPRKIPEEFPEELNLPNLPTLPSTFSEYSANIATTAYELDLFGRIRSLSQRDLERYFASEEAKNSTQIALIAEVANAYLSYLADTKLLKLTDDTLAAQQMAYDVVKGSFEMGVATLLDVAQAANSVETARANQFLYTRRVAQDKNALVLLMGAQVPESILEEQTIDEVAVMQNLPVGLSSEILLGRPDIKHAEHELKAANANIGAARAAFFPTITLIGLYGSTSDRLKDLFHSGSHTWSYIAQITQPIFTGGRNTANLDNAKAREKIAVALYERAIQAAFREVADQLAARGTYANQLQAQKALVAANQQAYDLATARYRQGISTYLNVLDSQQDLYTAQQGEIIVQQRNLSNMISLYKVLGGGQQ